MGTHKYITSKKVHLFSRSGEQICKQLNINPSLYGNSAVLDCASGTSSLVAYLRKHAIHARAIDPIYAHDPNKIFNIAAADKEEIRKDLFNEYPEYRLEIERTFRIADEHLQFFMQDISDHRMDYINASFPHLPFKDKTFDAIFTSNFLFTYSSEDKGGILKSKRSLDFSFHAESFRELVRTSKKEIRVFPVDRIDSSGYEVHPYLTDILQRHSDDIEWSYTLSPSFASHKPFRLLLTAFHKPNI